MKKTKPQPPKGNFGPKELYLLLDVLILDEKDLENIKAQVSSKTKKARSKTPGS